MKPCPEWNDAVLDAAAGQPRRAALEQHLAGCAACASALANWEARASRLGAALTELAAVEPAAYTAERLLARIRSTPPARHRWWAVPAALTLAAAAFLALFLGTPLTPDRRPPPAPMVTLTQWQSPTQWLLLSAATPMLRGVPSLGKDLPPARKPGEKDVR